MSYVEEPSFSLNDLFTNNNRIGVERTRSLSTSSRGIGTQSASCYMAQHTKNSMLSSTRDLIQKQRTIVQKTQELLDKEIIETQNILEQAKMAGNGMLTLANTLHSLFENLELDGDDVNSRYIPTDRKGIISYLNKILTE